jgi:hypothetical protein
MCDTESDEGQRESKSDEKHGSVSIFFSYCFSSQVYLRSICQWVCDVFNTFIIPHGMNVIKLVCDPCANARVILPFVYTSAPTYRIKRVPKSNVCQSMSEIDMIRWIDKTKQYYFQIGNKVSPHRCSCRVWCPYRCSCD